MEVKKLRSNAELLGNESLNPLLSSVGKPINKNAKQKEIKPGDPLYLITSLPFSTAFPILNNIAEDKKSLKNVLSEFQTDLTNFYSEQNFITTPIWILDELELTKRKKELIELALVDNPLLTVCSTERSTIEEASLKFQINRVILLDDQNNLIRDDRPSYQAERPGSLPILLQLQQIKKAHGEKGKNEFLLEDTGFASGKSVKTIAQLLEQIGIEVTKAIGSVGWFPKAWDELQKYNPNRLIWFDLGKGAWVEDRDFLLLPQSGILVGEISKETGETKLAKKFLNGDHSLPIDFTLPDVIFEGRWFRITDNQSIKQLQKICLINTLKIFEAIKPKLTVGELAYFYNQTDNLFTLPVKFGNLDSQLSSLTPNTIYTEYLINNFDLNNL